MQTNSLVVAQWPACAPVQVLEALVIVIVIVIILLIVLIVVAVAVAHKFGRLGAA